jgi:hypothetical protein
LMGALEVRSFAGWNGSAALNFSSHAMHIGLPAEYNSVSVPQVAHVATDQNYTPLPMDQTVNICLSA